ncbi:MAG TPA: hypothetical protein PLH95_13480 [Thauera aminoaromatica]|nr:hypothetical protein [Thauera aminoaromatica]
MFFIVLSLGSHFGACGKTRPACRVERHLRRVSAKSQRPALSPRKAAAHRMATPFWGWPFRSG